MLIPQKVNVVFDPLSSSIGAGRLELLGIEEKQRLKLVNTILTGAIEFIATTILTAGIGAVFQTTKAVTDLALLGTQRIIQVVSTKFTEAAITSSKFAISSALVQTTSGAIQGESAKDIVEEVSISAAVITSISFAQAAIKSVKIAVGIKKVQESARKFQQLSAKAIDKITPNQPLHAKTISNINKTIEDLGEELFNSVAKIQTQVKSSIVEQIAGISIGKQLKGIDSLQSLALSKLKLSALRKLLKKGAKTNTRINKFYQAANRISKKQKALEKKIRKTIKDKIKPITDIFNIDNVKKQFNNHFDSQTKEYNDLISRSRKDINAIEKLKLSQDMDNFILETQGAMPISGQVGSQWLLGYKWIPNINKNKSAEDQLDATVVEGSLRIFFKSRIPKRARIKHKGKWYYPKPMKAAITYKEVPYQVFQDFINASSAGEFYWETFAMHRLKGGGKTKGWQPRSTADIAFLINKQSIGQSIQSGIYGLGIGGKLKGLLYKDLGYIPGMHVAIKYWNNTNKIVGYIKNPLASAFNFSKKSLVKRLSI